MAQFLHQPFAMVNNCSSLATLYKVTFKAGVVIRHVDMPCKAISGQQTARWMTTAHNRLTYAPITTLPAQPTINKHLMYAMHN